jgi:hypothetical protein
MKLGIHVCGHINLIEKISVVNLLRWRWLYDSMQWVTLLKINSDSDSDSDSDPDWYLHWWTSRGKSMKHWNALLHTCKSTKTRSCSARHKRQLNFKVAPTREKNKKEGEGGKSGSIVNWIIYQPGIKGKGLQGVYKLLCIRIGSVNSIYPFVISIRTNNSRLFLVCSFIMFGRYELYIL